MNNDDDIDSSDVDIGTPRKNRFHAAGLDSINAIIESAAVDRMASKKSQKRLQFTEACSKTHIESTPTGSDIERFLYSVVTKSRTYRDVPSLSWLKGGLERLIPKLRFDYQDFALSSNELSRLKSTVRSMLRDGLITDEPARESHWIGSILIRRMIISSIIDAAANGTYNWDKVVQRALRNVLLASLSCRVGDIMVDGLDDEEFPYLYFNDIVMKLVGGSRLENLEALISIRNEKRMEKKKKEVRVVFLRCLPQQEDNPMCTIKWILISALRLGALGEKSLGAVLEATAARRDKTVQWAPGRGRSPVLCSFKGHWVDVDKPANTHQPKLLIRGEGLNAGLLAPIRAHDVRRGAARDIAHLPERSMGLATGMVADAMGHTEATRAAGVTKRYVGYTRTDNWAQRVDARFNDPFGVTVAPAPFKHKRRSRIEWLQIYANAGVDKSNRNETLKIRLKVRKEEERIWMAHERGPAIPFAC
ncbi:hypothetical protein V502_02138 [Pseudogymnoascus sp. VKM F-4520 (FW-2644)]|nr:hypothetical protein V502_02138 [Pseudogymnoascus sp. VKM F-4520 (FW-2644)]